MKTGLESLDTGAPEITYSGNEGPKSPQQMQQMQQMQMAQLEEEYDAYVDDMLEQGIEPMSMQQFLEQIAAEAQMSSNEEGIGSMMEDPREMAADGGIMNNKKIKGQDHMLAYITPNEVEKLKALGGQETMTKEGIPAYPEFDNYTDVGGGSRSNFEGGAYGGTGNAGERVAKKYNKQFKELEKKEKLAKEKEKQKVIEEMLNTPVGRNKRVNPFSRYNSKIQRKVNLDRAKKRAFQKYRDVEQYVDPFDDYTKSGQEMAELRGYTFDDQGNITGYDRDKATAYGYDTSRKYQRLDPGMKNIEREKGT